MPVEMIDIIKNIRQLTRIRSQWDALAELQKSPLLHFDWFVSCAETIHADDEIFIVVVGEGDSVEAIAPLCLMTRDGVATLELLGSSALYEPTNFLYRNEQSLKRLLRAVIKLGFPLVLLRLPDDPLLHKCIQEMAWRRGIVLRKQSASSAFLGLSPDWGRFLGKLSPSRRYDFRRKRKCLEKSGQVTTRVLSPTLPELPALLQEALLVEDKSWKGQQGTSLLKNSRLRSFFETYLRKACENASVRLCYIDIDGTPVSMHIAIASHDAFWVLKLGYDEAFARCSPGAQLAMDTIEYSVRNGLSRYEFLGSEEPWQHAWPTEAHAYFTVLVYPYSPRGLLGFFMFLIRYARKHISSGTGIARE